MKILTLPGEEFEITDPTLRSYLCYLDDGRLFVSKAHEDNPHVRAFVARLRRLGRPVHVHRTDMTVIELMYAEARGLTKAGRFSITQMQFEAAALFQRAVRLRASDIHIRVSRRQRTKFFCIHNDLEFIKEETFEYGEQFCTAIYQSLADVSDATFETLSHQDARISDKSKLPEQLDGIQIATAPQVGGFVMVLRLLYNDDSESTDLVELGFTEQQAAAFALLKRRPTGINIIGGPTGSGKSTTLQRVLTPIHKDYQGCKHVITVEDPPEYLILGTCKPL